MSREERDPFAELMSLRRMLDVLLQETYALPRPVWPAAQGGLLPVDVSESDDAYVVKVSLPGAQAEDVVVAAEASGLRVRVTVPDSGEGSPGTLVYRPRAAGEFERAITLARPVLVDKATVTSRAGIVTVTLPKAP